MKYAALEFLSTRQWRQAPKSFPKVPQPALAGTTTAAGRGMTASFPRSTLHNVVGSDESGEWKSGQVEI
ncbi:hypothetical protein ColTof4_10183 [Colletotrichum tofieldiae]|nr:hypothetical protein ColTof4_10183 [Colletotrichum tofieldiae]